MEKAMAVLKAKTVLEGKRVKVRKRGEKFDNTRLMSDDEWYPKAVRGMIRPARWNWQDCYAKLKEISSDPIPGADRRFIILVNEDTQEMMGTAPGALIGMTILNPGEGLKAHRHNSFAIYHIIQGKGFDVMQNEEEAEPTKIEWAKGDTFLCPAWTYHHHRAGFPLTGGAAQSDLRGAARGREHQAREQEIRPAPRYRRELQAGSLTK